MNGNKVITSTITFKNLSDSETRRKEAECRGLGWNYTIEKANGMRIETKITIPKNNNINANQQ